MASTKLGTSSFITGIATLLYSYTRDPPVPTFVPAVSQEGVVFQPWQSEDGSNEEELAEPECTWHNSSITYTSELCTPFHASRLATTNAKRAEYRALRCAAAARVECVLGAEIGFALPSLFLYNGVDTMTMIAAPRLIEHESETTWVKARSPSGGVPMTIEVNKTIVVEYIGSGSRAPVTQTFHGDEAFCVQLARHAYASACWELLD
jgi:hypothetical protein